MLRIVLIVFTAVFFYSCSTPDVPSITPIEPEFTVRRNLISLVPEFDGLLIDPSECAFDDEGNLYVLDVVTCQILVIDSDLQVVDVYGGEGNGPGELPPGPKLMAVGQDRIVVMTWPSIHLFDLNGLFLKRFSIHDSVMDLDIGPNGEIIATILDENVQLVAWDQEGNELYRRGRPFLALPMTREMAPYRRANETRVEALEDGTIAVLGKSWMRVRFYRGEECSEHLIDFRPLPTEERYNDVYTNMLKDYKSHSPKRAEARLARGTLKPDDLPQWSPILSPYASAHDGDFFWIANIGILCRVNREGIIDRICVCGWEMPGWLKDFAVSGTKVAYCFGDDANGHGIAVGEMHFTEPE